MPTPINQINLEARFNDCFLDVIATANLVAHHGRDD